MTSWIAAALRAPVSRSRPSPAIHPLGWALGTLCTWQRRASDRAALAALNDRLLADIGLTRAQARAEADKPFWRE